MSGKTASERRARRGIITVLAIMVAGYLVALNHQAWRAGFFSKAQMDLAFSRGLSSRAELVEHQHRAREREDAVRKQGSENAAEMARAAALACPKDIECWGQKHASAASAGCAPLVERLAKFQFEWTSRWTDQRFPRARWLDQTKGQMTYIGDAIKFQNGFGAWQYHTYFCDFDPSTGRVLRVNSQPGRLPP